MRGDARVGIEHRRVRVLLVPRPRSRPAARLRRGRDGDERQRHVADHHLIPVAQLHPALHRFAPQQRGVPTAKVFQIEPAALRGVAGADAGVPPADGGHVQRDLALRVPADRHDGTAPRTVQRDEPHRPAARSTRSAGRRVTGGRAVADGVTGDGGGPVPGRLDAEVRHRGANPNGDSAKDGTTGGADAAYPLPHRFAPALGAGVYVRPSRLPVPAALSGRPVRPPCPAALSGRTGRPSVQVGSHRVAPFAGDDVLRTPPGSAAPSWCGGRGR